jgi:hypothetical protein
MAKAEEAIKGIKCDIKALFEKIDRLQWWIMSTAVGVATTLAVNLILILIKKGG